MSLTINKRAEDFGPAIDVWRNTRPISRMMPTMPASAATAVSSVVKLSDNRVRVRGVSVHFVRQPMDAIPFWNLAG